MDSKVTSQVIQDAARVIHESNENSLKISAVIREIEEQKESSEKQIVELKAGLPGLLANKAMGAKGAADQVRAQKDKCGPLQEIIDDFPLAVQGLNQMLFEQRVPTRDAYRVLDTVHRYGRLKEIIKKDRSFAHARSLRTHAGVLGVEKDCEDFLREMRL